LENFKTENPEDFVKTFSKYRKRQKNIINVEKIITEKVKDYFILLKENNIDVIIVDEAHHLTNWWSNVIFYLWKYL
jgi:superfamily II DNA or RNA helicase